MDCILLSLTHGDHYVGLHTVNTDMYVVIQITHTGMDRGLDLKKIHYTVV